VGRHSAPVYKWRLLPDSLVNNGLYLPGGINFYLMSGFTPSTAQFVHNNIISKEVCRMFVLRCQSTSHLTCLVSFHRVSPIIYSYTIIRSYKVVHTSIQVTFIQSYINTFTYSYINTYTTYTQHQFTRVCISHPKSCLTISFQFGSQLSLCQVASLNQRTTCIAKITQCLCFTRLVYKIIAKKKMHIENGL